MKLRQLFVPLLLFTCTYGSSWAYGPNEGLTKQEVGQVVKLHRGQIRECDESTKADSGLIDRRVVVAFTILVDGSVTNARVESSTAANTKLEACILSQLESWKFPKPMSLAEVDVSYPFIFRAIK